MATFTDPSTMPKVVKDGSVQLSDSGGTNDFTVDYEDGDIGFAIGPGDIDETIVVYDRSTIAASRKGKQQPIEISFTVKLKTFTNSKTSATNPGVTPRRDQRDRRRVGVDEGQREPRTAQPRSDLRRRGIGLGRRSGQHDHVHPLHFQV